METLCLVVSLLFVLILIYWFLTKTFNHWEKNNIPYLPNAVPGFGHILSIFTLKENISTFLNRTYKMSDDSMTGFYFLRKPALLIRDPELVKIVLQSNFSSFHANGITLNEKNDPILSKNPFFISDYQSWKIARARITNYLSNIKLNYLFIIVKDISVRMSDFIDKQIQKNDSVYECELKINFSRYTSEIVANSAFGINGQSFHDNPDKFAFINVASTLFDTSIIHGIRQTLILYMSDVANFLGISFLQKNTEIYFRENLKAIIKQRKQENSTANDYLQFCIDKNSEDLDGIISDVIVFYLFVYETSSTVLSILFYHLSQYTDIQQKLRAHVNMTLKESGGIITFDSLKNMDYLERVILESIRFLAPIGQLMKSCTKEITLTGHDNLTCLVRPKDVVFLSIFGLHSDNKYWKDPHIFDPERFTKENQNNVHKFAFLGFGEGPRRCAGMRFGMILMKLVTASLISKFSIQHSEKTKTPLELISTTFVTLAQGGLWAKFQKLSEINESKI